MPDYIYVLIGRCSDRCELLHHGTVTGSDPIEIIKQQLDIRADSDNQIDLSALIDKSDSDELCWQLELLDNRQPYVADRATTGSALGTGYTSVRIPCRAHSAEQPDAADPEVKLDAMLYPMPAGPRRPAPTTRFGSLLRQFGIDSSRRIRRQTIAA